MSGQSVQILEGNFADFVKNQNEEDYFSKKIKELNAQLSDPTVSMSEDKKVKIKELLTFVDNLENMNKLPIFSKKFISLKNNKNQSKKVFNNLLPYGSNEHVSDFLTLESADISSDKFFELGNRLFPDTFSKERLKYGFMSLFLFPTINSESFGLYDIQLLGELFDLFFINSNLTDSATIKGFIDSYFKKEKIFKNINIESLKQKINGSHQRVFSGNEFFKFDCKLWYDSFDEKISNSNKGRIAVILDKPNSSDSYGQFVSLPDLKDGKSNILGTYVRSRETYQFTLLPNMRKRCFVIPKISIVKGTEKQLFTEDTNLTNSSDYLKNIGFLLFYNFQNYSGQDIEIKEDSRTKEKTILNTTQLYTDIDNFARIAGGSKKNKMIGGSRNDLFDKTSEPFLLLKREKYVYDKNIFYECLQKLRKTYRLSEFKNKLNNILNIVYQSKEENVSIVFPVVYSKGQDLKIGSFQLTYEELRLIFHFSYLYTTFIKLLLFFFKNLIKIYQTFVFYFDSQIKTENKSKPLDEQKKIQFYEENIRKFTILNSEISTLIKILELTINCGEDQINNFFGFNITFYKNFGKSQDDIRKAYKIQENFIYAIIDLLFEGFTQTSSIQNVPNFNIIIRRNQFTKLLQKLSEIFPVNFGGVPLIDLPKTQNSFLVSYSYFIRFRYVCQRNFSQFKKFYNIADKQKLTNQEIKNISNDVNKEVNNIVASKNKFNNLKDKCKKICKNVLVKFITTIEEIQQISQKQQSSEASVHSNSTEDETNVNTKVTEFKVYIAIIEKKIEFLIKAESEAAIRSGQRLFIDPKTLFLFMMGRFNNFIYILESFLLNSNENAFNYFKKDNLEQIYKDFEDKFFNKKPVYPNYLKEILENKNYFRVNPLNSNPSWWSQKELEFKNNNGKSSRLFMLCIRKNVIGSDLVLVDPFSCALTPSGEKILQKKFLDLSYTYEGSGRDKKIVDMQYSPSNNSIINLTPSLRIIRELWSKFKSKNIKRIDKNTISSMPSDFFIKVLNKVPNSVSTNNKTRNNPLTTMKNVVRLLKGLLKDEFGNNIKPVILQGRNQDQLLKIIARNMLLQKDDIKDNEYQLIEFTNSDFEDSDKFRKILSNVLFSPPQSCFDENSALVFNLFNEYQKPVSSKTFLNKIKLGGIGLGGLVKDFFSAIEPTNIDRIRAVLNGELRNSKNPYNRRMLIFNKANEILEASHNLIHQQKLQELLIQKESHFYAIKNRTQVNDGKLSKNNTRLDIQNNSTPPTNSRKIASSQQFSLFGQASSIGQSLPFQSQFLSAPSNPAVSTTFSSSLLKSMPASSSASLAIPFAPHQFSATSQLSRSLQPPASSDSSLPPSTGATHFRGAPPISGFSFNPINPQPRHNTSSLVFGNNHNSVIKRIIEDAKKQPFYNWVNSFKEKMKTSEYLDMIPNVTDDKRFLDLIKIKNKDGKMIIISYAITSKKYYIWYKNANGQNKDGEIKIIESGKYYARWNLNDNSDIFIEFIFNDSSDFLSYTISSKQGIVFFLVLDPNIGYTFTDRPINS
jgi:hypothetical protein